MSKRSVLRTLALESLEPRDMMTVSMSPYDQLLLELINQARADPGAEAARYGIDLNQGLSAGTISATAKQPLAPNQILIDAAGDHSQDMLSNNFFSHTNLTGQSPSDRAIAAGYSTWVGENIAWGGSTGPINQLQHVYSRHRNLFESPGHRQNMLRASYEEIGVGVRFGPFTTSGNTYNASMVTEKFGSPGINAVITGVVFTDAADGSNHDDDFYSVGEQVNGGTITATDTSSGAAFTTNIGISGGYALQVGAGTYDVVATDGNSGQSYLASHVVVGSENVKVDFETTTAAGATNGPPTLQPISDIQIVLTQPSVSTTLVADDPESSQLTYSATVENLAYHLDQTLGLTTNANVPENWGGLGEKWLQGETGSWYFLTRSGEFFEWDGSGPGSLSGELVATLDPSYYLDESLLHSAQSGIEGVEVTVSGATLNLVMESAIRGTFVVVATVSDGDAIDTQTFHVTKGFRLAHHHPAQGLRPAAANTYREDAGVGRTWQPHGSHPMSPLLTASSLGNVPRNSSGLTSSLVRTLNTVHDDLTWQIHDGQHDDTHRELGSNRSEEQAEATRSTRRSSVAIHNEGDGRTDLGVGNTTAETLAVLDGAFALLDDVFAGSI